MSELELRENLSSKTVDALVEIIIRLLHLISELEMEVQVNKENKNFMSVLANIEKGVQL